MYTGTFKGFCSDPRAIAIALWLPRRPAFRGPRYLPLAPTRGIFYLPDSEFTDHFKAQLDRLDPQSVYDDLVRLAGPEAILCCYEPAGFSCHRRMVAEWLEDRLGLEIPEIGMTRQATGRYADLPLLPSVAALR